MPNQVFLDIFGYKTVAEIGVVNPRELYTDREYASFLERHEKRQRGESVRMILKWKLSVKTAPFVMSRAHAVMCYGTACPHISFSVSMLRNAYRLKKP